MYKFLETMDFGKLVIFALIGYSCVILIICKILDFFLPIDDYIKLAAKIVGWTIVIGIAYIFLTNL